MLAHLKIRYRFMHISTVNINSLTTAPFFETSAIVSHMKIIGDINYSLFDIQPEEIPTGSIFMLNYLL